MKGTGPIGAVLAGGQGRRIGGEKATVEIAGRPLVCYPIEALREVVEEVVVVVKADTELPEMVGVSAVWVEPDGIFHPLAGIVHALRMAAGRPVLACAGDLPLITPEVLRAVLDARPDDAPAVIARAGGRLQPLVGLYTPLALAGLSGYAPDAPTREVVEALGAAVVEVEDADAFYNVNAPEDVLQASALLSARAVREPEQPST